MRLRSCHSWSTEEREREQTCEHDRGKSGMQGHSPIIHTQRKVFVKIFLLLVVFGVLL